MEPAGAPAPYADVEVSFAANLDLRAMVRSIAVEVAHSNRDYTQEVRETTDALVCALLQFAPKDSRLRCQFRALDGEVRVRASLSDSPVPAPEAKSRSARLLDRLDVYVSTFTRAGDDQRTELVCEAVVPRSDHVGAGL